MVWVYLCIYTPISGHFERPTLRGCIFAADCGRVVASLQRLPCQKTKPKGLWCGSELWWFGFICVFTRLYVDGFERPTLRGCIFAANYDRVVASLQRLPCQRTKPKGLLLHFLVVVLAYSCIAIIDAYACDDWTYTSVNLI